MKSPKFRTAYGERIKQSLSFKGDDGRTIVEQQDSTDINNILERYARTGLIDHVAKHEPQYAEFGQYDFQANQNMIAKITQTFEELPAKVRSGFDNNPQNFVEFISQQENIDDMKDGIIGNEIPEQVDEKPVEPTEKPVSWKGGHSLPTWCNCAHWRKSWVRHKKTSETMLKKPLILYVLKQIAVALKKLKEDLSDERQKKNERSQSKKTVLKNSKLNPQIQPTKSKDDDARRH